MKRPSDTPDKEDKTLLAGKSRSYIIGWNRVKHRGDKHELERTDKPVGRAAPGKERSGHTKEGEE